MMVVAAVKQQSLVEFWDFWVFFWRCTIWHWADFHGLFRNDYGQ